MKVKSVEQSAAKWVERTIQSEKEWLKESMRAFLEGQQSLAWIAGIIFCVHDVPLATELFAELRGHGKADRYRELELWFQSGCPMGSMLSRARSSAAS